MNLVDRDEFAHVLGQTLKFYGKTLEKSDFSFWYSAMGDRSIYAIKNALKEYVKVGKYAPRPANVMELLHTRAEHARTALPPPQTITTCPPEIAAAWSWFIGVCARGSKNLEGACTVPDITPEQQDKYLHLVNHEAMRLKMPDAIPDQFKLAEVWGEA